MELRILRYFLAVAREENITKAAELLHITPRRPVFQVWLKHSTALEKMQEEKQHFTNKNECSIIKK